MNLGRNEGVRKAHNEELTYELYIWPHCQAQWMSLVFPHFSNKVIHTAVAPH